MGWAAPSTRGSYRQWVSTALSSMVGAAKTGPTMDSGISTTWGRREACRSPGPAQAPLSLSAVARYNRTSYFYPTFSESSEHSHLLVSPVLVASAVIGVVIILSCITIIVGSIRRDRQARLQRHRHRHHHHHHRRRHREYEHGYGELPPRGPCTCILPNGDCYPGHTGKVVLREGVSEVLGHREEFPDAHQNECPPYPRSPPPNPCACQKGRDLRGKLKAEEE